MVQESGSGRQDCGSGERRCSTTRATAGFETLLGDEKVSGGAKTIRQNCPDCSRNFRGVEIEKASREKSRKPSRSFLSKRAKRLRRLAVSSALLGSVTVHHRTRPWPRVCRHCYRDARQHHCYKLKRLTSGLKRLAITLAAPQYVYKVHKREPESALHAFPSSPCGRVSRIIFRCHVNHLDLLNVPAGLPSSR